MEKKPLIARCAEAAGCAWAAILLYRICYYQQNANVEREGHLWVYHTEDEWRAEMGEVTRWRYRKALDLLKSRELIEVRAFLHYNTKKTHVRLIGAALDLARTQLEELNPDRTTGRIDRLTQQAGQPVARPVQTTDCPDSSDNHMKEKKEGEEEKDRSSSPSARRPYPSSSREDRTDTNAPHEYRSNGRWAPTINTGWMYWSDALTSAGYVPDACPSEKQISQAASLMKKLGMHSDPCGALTYTAAHWDWFARHIGVKSGRPNLGLALMNVRAIMEFYQPPHDESRDSRAEYTTMDDLDF